MNRPKGFRVQLTFKSGAQVDFWVEEWTTTKRGVYKSYEWHSLDGTYPKISSFEADDVTCVVVLEDNT